MIRNKVMLEIEKASGQVLCGVK